MNILITNDDGYQSKGIDELVSLMEQFGQVYMVAPDKNQSGTSHAITINSPLNYKKIKENQYVTSGTPADCMHFAFHHLWEASKFDLCVSGINHGANLCDDVWYSGTVGGAVEAALNGIPSVAISQILDVKDGFDWGPSIGFLKKWFENHTTKLWNAEEVLNINMPAQIKSDEPVWTKLGAKRYISHIDVREDPRGNGYFWIGGELGDLGSQEGTDACAIARQSVSITPLNLNLTHAKALSRLQK